MNWGYKTIPQEHCNGREIDISRGKGLGGSSAINFSVYLYGARDDYDEWASLVGDDSFQWNRMQPRFKNLENFNDAILSTANVRYASPNPSGHGTKGPLHTSYAAEWDRDLPLMMDIFEEIGLPLNLNVNSGNPIGVSLFVNSTRQGVRATAADLILNAPDNLTILTESPVHRVIMQGKKAVGVETKGDQCIYVSDPDKKST